MAKPTAGTGAVTEPANQLSPADMELFMPAIAAMSAANREAQTAQQRLNEAAAAQQQAIGAANFIVAHIRTKYAMGPDDTLNDLGVIARAAKEQP